MMTSTINGQQAGAALRKLSAAEVDSITGMGTQGDDGWQRIVEGLRDAVAEAYEYGRFASEDEGNILHEIADGQVPVYNSERVRELSIIGAAWSYEPETSTAGADMLTIIGYVLYEVYRNGAGELVEWVSENVSEDDEDETDEEV